MFKKALKIAIQVVLTPQIAWSTVSNKKIDIYKDFLVPIWSIIILATFLGGWFVVREGSFEIGIRNVIIEAFGLIIGFQISSYLLNEYIKTITDDVDKDTKHTRFFVAISSSLVYLINIVVSLVNDFFFLWLFTLYTFYIVYVGAETFYNIIAERRTNFMIIASLLILGVPLLLKYILSLMMAS